MTAARRLNPAIAVKWVTERTRRDRRPPQGGAAGGMSEKPRPRSNPILYTVHSESRTSAWPLLAVGGGPSGTTASGRFRPVGSGLKI